MSPGTHPSAHNGRRRIRRRIVAALLTASLLPLALLAVGGPLYTARQLEQRVIAEERVYVASHAREIDAFLRERRRLLEVVATTSERDELGDPARLREVLRALDAAVAGGFVDLGVIDASGHHVGYVGPYDLADRDYREAEWFHETMTAGSHVSDVFLGFRGVPHVIIAVRSERGPEPWILRATLDSKDFDRIVRTGELGPTTDVFLVDRAGRYQSPPRVGGLLETAEIPTPVQHQGVRDTRLVLDGVDTLMVTAWLNHERWQLVVLVEAERVREPVRRALELGLALLAVAVTLVVVTTAVATRLLGRQIDRADRQRADMVTAFLRSAKLASVGELATGLAHEINNPLAIISAEQTNLTDILAMPPGERERNLGELRESAERIRRQIERCASITTKMLQFGRRDEPHREPVELAPRLESVVALLGRQASVRNVELQLDAPPGLPPVVADPIELEQVVVNLVNNSFQAMPDGGRLTIRARAGGERVLLEVADTGQGMPPEVLERIFEPFFTTKPVGRGTGLGLAVCHGIIQSWGGSIEASSEVGRGTTMRLSLPVADRGESRHGEG